ncbi:MULTISPECIES: TetR family transcriptional regulator [unclassified Rhodococcus (in: high G+C Gram-positive bacteria)]|uniref:TetR/AcrR family transcriptional regulator n=1 Tax=Rhodococcus sp. SJ-3 TaxID=3454628 RepID=UPI003F7B16BF
MKRTDQVVTRDKERTRRAILDAAEQMFSERGSKVSLADIAAAAGVTKSGLMHHFPNRDALVYGVIEHGIVRMWEEVHAHIELSENKSGKFTRGYVRALTGGSDYLMDIFNPGTLIATLGSSAEVEALYGRDAEKWDAAFAADGLPWPRVLVIRAAAEGLAIAAASPYLSSDDLALARAELLALTDEP